MTIGETYGASQRGGAVMSHLRVSRQTQYGPLIAEGQADIILGLEPLETMRVLAQYGNPGRHRHHQLPARLPAGRGHGRRPYPGGEIAAP